MTNFFDIPLFSPSNQGRMSSGADAGKRNAEKINLDDISRFFEILRPSPSPFDLVRIGGTGDGAYLIPYDLTGIAACFSPGVNNFKNFEDELSLKLGIPCHLCDYSSDVDHFASPLYLPLQSFSKKWLAAEPGPDSLTLPEWIDRHVQDPSHDLMLQMDIEGAEYKILLSLDRSVLARFRILVVEFHSLHRALVDPQILGEICLPLMEKISRDFICVHAHPNNYLPFGHLIPGYSASLPEFLELTFLRRDRFCGSPLSSHRPVLIPHPLDVTNAAANKPFFLESDWSGGRRHWRSRLKMLQEKIRYRLPRNPYQRV